MREIGRRLIFHSGLQEPHFRFRLAVDDSFGESGTPAQLMTKYGLDADNIIAKVKRVMAKKVMA